MEQSDQMKRWIETGCDLISGGNPRSKTPKRCAITCILAALTRFAACAGDRERRRDAT